MRSFSAVNNFRSVLNTRWKQFGYSFERKGVLFNWTNICFSNRVMKPSLVFSKVGVYFSHFVFSDSGYNPSFSFFFDTYFDRKYLRFSNLATKLLQSNKSFIKSPNVLSNSSVQKFRYAKLRGHFITEVLKSSNISFMFFSGECFSSYFLRSKVIFTKLAFNNFARFFKILEIFSGFNNCSSRSSQKRVGFKRVVKFYNSNIKPQPQIKYTNKRVKARNAHSAVLDFFFKSSINKFVFARLSCTKWKKLAWKLSKFVEFNIFKTEKYKARPFFTKFRTLLLGSIRFFLSYYFKYDPARLLPFVEIHQSFFQEKFGYLPAYIGYKFRHIHFMKKSVSSWFLKNVYTQFLRFNFFFLFRSRFQIGKSYFGNTRVVLNNLSGFTTIPASLISKMFAFRLKRRERLNPVLYSLVRLVLVRQKILGLVISKAGRFTKRQRTSKSITRFGRVSFNSYIMPIDYSFSTAILKYSMVSIKIWISFLPPVNFFFHKSISSSLVYPMTFQFFKSLNYLYIWSTSGLLKYAHKKYSGFYRKNRELKLEIKFFRSGFSFISGWNFFYFRSYRRFSKYFAFSQCSRRKVTSLLVSLFLNSKV